MTLTELDRFERPMTEFDEVALMRSRLYTALLSDVLDGLGHMGQALPARIRPLDDGLVLVGRARTLQFELFGTWPAPDENPYEIEIALVDSLGRDDVVVMACGDSGLIAPWGGLLSTASQYRGAAGAITDGLVRDIKQIRDLQFPVFHAGIAPLDTKGRAKAVAMDVPILCGGVSVSPGDLVFGDADGCVIVPKAIEAEVLDGAFRKLVAEDDTLSELRAGKPLADVFRKFGVL